MDGALWHTLHDFMVANLASQLSQDDWANICVDLPAHFGSGQARFRDEQPIAVRGRAGAFFRPDVTAWHSDKLWLFEVETEESLGTSHTELQLEAFVKFGQAWGGGLVLAVPDFAWRGAVAQLDTLGLRGLVVVAHSGVFDLAELRRHVRADGFN